MIKSTKLFVLTLAMTIVGIIAFCINTWAFPTYTWQDPVTGGQINVTPIIGYANKTWIYEVKNINYNPGYGVDFFALNPYPDGTSIWVNSMKSPSANWTSTLIDSNLVFFPPPGNSNQVTWFTQQTQQNERMPGILPGSQGAFIFQTNPVGIDFVPGWGFAGWASNTLGFFGDVIVPSPTKAPEGLAKITEVNGTVTITTPSGTKPATVGTILYTGDVVETGPNSSADVGFDDGSIIELRENSKFSQEGKAGGITFLDELGKIWNSLFKSSAERYDIRTPTVAVALLGVLNSG